MAEIEQVHDDLHMALGLHESTHHAKRPPHGPVILGEKTGGDYGMVRPFIRFQAVVVAGGIEGKIVPPVMQGNTRTGHNEA